MPKLLALPSPPSHQIFARGIPAGSFDFARVFNPPIEVCLVWINADSDDTKSSFRTIINQLDLAIPLNSQATHLNFTLP